MQSAQNSFHSIVAEHQNAVLRVCRSILRDDHLGADAAQETFLRLWQRLEQTTSGVARPLQTGAWLKRVAVTTSLDQLRARSRRAASIEDAGAEEPAPERLPEAELAARELDERFRRALDELSDGQRTVFLLRHSAGMPLAQVAETLGVAPTTVKTQFARAVLRLQEALRAFEPSE